MSLEQFDVTRSGEGADASPALLRRAAHVAHQLRPSTSDEAEIADALRRSLTERPAAPSADGVARLLRAAEYLTAPDLMAIVRSPTRCDPRTIDGQVVLLLRTALIALRHPQPVRVHLPDVPYTHDRRR